jgi:PKD repeat protein
MKALRKSVILTVCLMLVFSLFGQKEKKHELTLEQMRAEIAMKGLTFTVGENDALNRPLESLCGLVIPPDWQQTGRFDGGGEKTRALPASYDWRDYGVVTTIQNQGSCGSCWAFGTIGSYESCCAVAGGTLYNLSEQWLLDCNTLGYSCAGGWWGYPDMYNGVPLESCYPYVGVQGSCNTSCPKYYPMDEWYYVGNSSSVADTTDMKNAIYTHGPISAAVYVDSYFQAYTGGIFSNTASYQPNHAIVLVGWNDTGGYWILKNSWGTSWGENGYMRIEYAANNVGYAAAYGVPESIIPQPPAADFTADPNPVQYGNSVQFTDLSMYIPTSWSWTFEGGTPATSTDQNPLITYNTIGTYTVTLTATNELGSDTETKVDYINVQEVVLNYCESRGTNCSYEYIANVTVDTFSNSSGASTYTDFTYLTADLTAGNTVNVSLTPGFPSTIYTEYWKIWIDYNVDGDFEDAGEEVFSGVGDSTVTGSFTVASVTAMTRMRVSMKYAGYPTPCEIFTYGEVEDYTVNITSGGNIPPIADFTFATPCPETNFTDASTDPDGTVESWLWDFGDGNTSTEQNPTHTYAADGTYTVTLTVWDNEGEPSGPVSKIVTRTCESIEMYVYDITQTIAKKGKNCESTAVVTIRDTNNAPAANATVNITWSGVVSGSASGVTAANGTVTFKSAKVKSTGPFTITVDNVTHATLPYNPALNNETSDTAYY